MLPYARIDTDWLQEKFGIRFSAKQSEPATTENLKEDPRFFPASPAGRGFGDRTLLSSGEQPLNEDIEAIYEGMDDPDRILDSMYYPTAKTLMDAYAEGYEKPLFEPDWTIKDTELLNRVQNNIFSFSTVKSYAEANELRDSVYDKLTGRMRSRNDFRRVCHKIDARYNGRYLDTERNMVVIAETQGSRWVDFENSADTHPYLEYVTARDSRVREKHRTLDGIILPIEDPFWQQYYPPNDWNCRCRVQKRTEREYDRMKKRLEGDDARWKLDNTEARKKAGACVKKEFRHNAGTSYIFSKDDHPYYKANAAAKAEQMIATKHYGLLSLKDIYAPEDKKNTKKDLAKYKGGIQNKGDYDRFWDEMEAEYGEAGKGFTLIDKKNHVSALFSRKQLFEKLRGIKDMPTKKYPEPQRRWSYFDEIRDAFYDPDEVWSTLQGESRTETQYNIKTYMKYYEDMPVLIYVNDRNEVASFYKSNNLSGMEGFRNGFLIRKKR